MANMDYFHADYFKRVSVSYERKGLFSVANVIVNAANQNKRSQDTMDRTKQNWLGPRKTFAASMSSCLMKDSRLGLPHFSAPNLSVASKNTRTTLPFLLFSTFSAASNIRGRSFVFGTPSTFSFLCRGKGPSRTRPLELARVVMNLAIALTRKTNPFHENRTKSSAMEGSLIFTRKRQKLDLRFCDAYVVLNACLCFRGLALAVELTIARLISR